MYCVFTTARKRNHVIERAGRFGAVDARRADFRPSFVEHTAQRVVLLRGPRALDVLLVELPGGQVSSPVTGAATCILSQVWSYDYLGVVRVGFQPNFEGCISSWVEGESVVFRVDDRQRVQLTDVDECDNVVSDLDFHVRAAAVLR